ncbi:MAG: DUF5662 family protein [Actinomycetota bacterium]|nr:DUF5662 family protein [Actinomycetota bacterium]
MEPAAGPVPGGIPGAPMDAIRPEPESYDSTLDTLRHSRRVDELVLEMVADLLARVTRHDLSKMEDPEREMFDRVTPRLKASTYGSDEYKSFLADMGPGLEHHYAHNPHHPEHYPDGIRGMTLIDVAEMLADWRAAGERHADGDMAKSLAIQKERFDISPQLAAILYNTARSLGWLR